MGEEGGGAEDGAVAAEGADEICLVGEAMRGGGLVRGRGVGIDGEGETVVDFGCGGGLKDDVDGGVGAVEVGGVFDERGSYAGCALLLRYEDVSRRGGPLQGEQGLGGGLDV